MSSSLPLCLRLGFWEANVEMGFGVRDVKGRGRKQGWVSGEIEPMRAIKSWTDPAEVIQEYCPSELFDLDQNAEGPSTPALLIQQMWMALKGRDVSGGGSLQLR